MADRLPMEGIWRPPEEEEYLGFNVARVMACSSSSAVNGVSCAVICFDNTISGTEEFMPIPLSCCVRNFFERVVFMFRSAGADATAVEYSDILVLAVSTSRAVLADKLFSRLVLPELELFAWLSILSPDKTAAWWELRRCSCCEGRRLGARLCTLLGARLVVRLWILLCARLVARLCAFVPPGLNVPDRASEDRRLAAENASARLNAARLAWCSGSTLPLYLDRGIS